MKETNIEDLLNHLPCYNVLEYRKGDVIYQPSYPPTFLYLITEGMVGICGRRFVVDIYAPGQCFGETVFLGGICRTEEAVAFATPTKLMAWTTGEVEDINASHPGFGISLVRMFAQRRSDMTERIESLLTHNIRYRLARTLVHFSDRFGRKEESGLVRIFPFSQRVLSDYVGASRPVISGHLDKFRRLGCLHYSPYSRDGILLDYPAMQEWIHRELIAP